RSGTARPADAARPRSTRNPARAAASAASSTRRDLPIPGSPSTNTEVPRPSPADRTAAVRTSRSGSLPTSTDDDNDDTQAPCALFRSTPHRHPSKALSSPHSVVPTGHRDRTTTWGIFPDVRGGVRAAGSSPAGQGGRA
ncbi:hypothetical protein STRTUCAR8_02318, partial [Streptomyces turgidiscabies Car8]